MRFVLSAAVLGSLALGGLVACSAGSGSQGSGELEPGGRSGASGGSIGVGGSSGSSGSGGGGGTGGTVMVCMGEECPDGGGPPPVGICGDGILTEDEACDDGNTDDGDGCAANCFSVDPGYSCNPPGVPCHVIALCGDAFQASNEMCDDGNTNDGDGCSHRCKLELGYKCEATTCTLTTCGDGVQEGRESCDDGNAIPLDGCSATCQSEPDCSAGACTSDCGDGLIISEECDDGNTLDGDGCSSTCTLEMGFTCMQMPSCEPVGDTCALRVPVVYRDFTQAHDDFHCGGATEPPELEPALDPEGKPVLVRGNPGCITSQETFFDWYRTVPANAVIPSSLLLFDNGAGGYVNRFGPNGERWVDLNGVELDGNPAFLPIDGVPSADVLSLATIAPEYTGDGNWHPESDFVPDAMMHNFLFTTEVEYWFRFDAGFEATLDFLGDDDFWVFVNRTLALDLGGLHVPEAGLVTVSEATAAQYGLEVGNVYAIKVFHAERNPTGSSFKLTLSGFENAPTVCDPVCGDGVATLGEQCDDGVNDGGYGECEPGCVVGPRCGDGIVQEDEDCDDGNRLDGDGCGSACRDIVVK
jgi:fibro-slime domain-containing protein